MDPAHNRDNDDDYKKCTTIRLIEILKEDAVEGYDSRHDPAEVAGYFSEIEKNAEELERRFKEGTLTA
jgi:hypothetical protein